MEKGLLPHLTIFPEGATTNNEYILKFKKGAFVGLKSIKPLAFKYSSKISSYNGLLGIFAHFYLLQQNPYITLKIKECPVFQPNQYFWDNHLREGEEKWEAYARVMRDVLL